MAYSADGTRLIYSTCCVRATCPLPFVGVSSIKQDFVFLTSFFPFLFFFLGVGDIADSFHVVQVRKGSHLLLNGMKVKGLLKGPIKDSASVLWVLCNLIQLKTGFWLLVMISLSNSGIWTMFNFC